MDASAPVEALGAPRDMPRSLIYVSDQSEGIRRQRRGRGFSYILPDGARLSCELERARINALAIPPAYRDVWICALPNGHIQATGYDERGRKQYRYHPEWAQWRSTRKFAQLPAFGAALGKIRRRIDQDLQAGAGELDFSIAALLTLIDRAGMRVGNADYTAQNRTYGATTLLKRHLDIEGDVIRLSYRAKGGRKVSHTLRGRRLQRIFHEIDDLPGRSLFTYLDADGDARAVGSQQVNAYLEAVSGVPGATAKTFRTWAGSVAAFEAAWADPAAITIKTLCAAASEALHNTPAICRSSYIHPRVIGLAEADGQAVERRFARLDPAGVADLKAGERRLLAFLQSPTGKDGV